MISHNRVNGMRGNSKCLIHVVVAENQLGC